MSLDELFKKATRYQWQILTCWDCRNDEELHAVSCRYGTAKWCSTEEDREYFARRLIRLTDERHLKGEGHK